MSSLDFLVNVFVSLALGGLIGLEREQSRKPVVGVRSFALLALLGCVLSSFAGFAGMLIGLAGVSLIGAYYFKRRETGGVTTSLMIPLVFTFGVMVGFGRVFEAVVTAVASAFLLAEKREVHDIVSGITKRELLDLLAFALIAFVVSPIVPKTMFSVSGFSFDPSFFWGIVVIVSGIGLFGHAAVKYFKAKGFGLAVFFAGVVSSLASVAIFTKNLREQKDLKLVFGLALLGALLGDVALLAFAKPEMLFALSPLLASLALGALAVALLNWKHGTSGEVNNQSLSLGNAFEFALVLFVVSVFLSPFFATSIGPLAALVGGVVSSTAVIASSAQFFSQANAFSIALNIYLATLGSSFAKSAVLYKRCKSIRQSLEPVVIVSAFGLVGLIIQAIL